MLGTPSFASAASASRWNGHAPVGSEVGPIRPALPAEVMERERLLEGVAELRLRARPDELDRAQLFELPEPALVRASALRRRVRVVDGLEAGAELEDRRLDALDETQARGIPADRASGPSPGSPNRSAKS